LIPLTLARSPSSTHFPYTTLFRSIKTRIKVSESNTGWTAAMFVDGTFDIAVGAYTPISPNADLFANYLGSAVRNPTKIKDAALEDRKSTRLNSSHGSISYAVFCLK